MSKLELGIETGLRGRMDGELEDYKIQHTYITSGRVGLSV